MGWKGGLTASLIINRAKINNDPKRDSRVWCETCWKRWAGQEQRPWGQWGILQSGREPGKAGPAWQSGEEQGHLCVCITGRFWLGVALCEAMAERDANWNLTFLPLRSPALWKHRIPSDISLVSSENNQLLQIRERDLSWMAAKTDKTNASSHSYYWESVSDLNSDKSLIG